MYEKEKEAAKNNILQKINFLKEAVLKNEFDLAMDLNEDLDCALMDYLEAFPPDNWDVDKIAKDAYKGETKE